ncbi:MAG: hypothetical protein JXB24_02115, partial [Bacteroidales bacterium]|nr:hypothetical protein [Bacteroidales bacterium]
MERAKHKLILFLVLLACFSDISANIRSEIYNAYVNNRMDIWKNVIDRLEADKLKSSEQIIELVNYQYGYIGYCIGFKKKEEAKKYLELAEKNIEVLNARNYDPSTIHAYKCAFYGFRIGLNKITAPVNGLKSMEHARSALDLNRENYFAHIQYGNIQFYMPKTFGGSKKEGIGYFLKAKDLLERDPANLVENWNYLSLLVIIGQSYTY